MLNKEEILENLLFLKKIIDTTYNNTEYSNLKASCKSDLAAVENLAVSWEYEYKDVLDLEDQNVLMAFIFKLFSIWYTQKNKLRTKAYIIKPTDEVEDKIIREYKKNKNNQDDFNPFSNN